MFLEEPTFGGGENLNPNPNSNPNHNNDSGISNNSQSIITMPHLIIAMQLDVPTDCVTKGALPENQGLKPQWQPFKLLEQENLINKLYKWFPTAPEFKAPSIESNLNQQQAIAV